MTEDYKNKEEETVNIKKFYLSIADIGIIFCYALYSSSFVLFYSIDMLLPYIVPQQPY